MGDVAEAKAASVGHQKWMIETLKSHDGKCTYEEIVEEGEKHQCDTVGAMLKILKNRKVIKYDQVFLMYPMHKDEVIELVKPDYDPAAEP
mmetsp:Transcript_98533/g.136718  ORF Transcript_98533/g.136718 Transcript_98533/m.136718 type:complete len:90 (+) Transcript_98533:38-307(+)